MTSSWLPAASLAWLGLTIAPSILATTTPATSSLRVWASTEAAHESCLQVQAGGSPELQGWYRDGTGPSKPLMMSEVRELSVDMQSGQSRVHLRREGKPPELSALVVDWVIVKRQDDRPGTLSGMSLTLEDARGPVERWAFDAQCRALERRRLVYGTVSDPAKALIQLNPASHAVIQVDALNPPVPSATEPLLQPAMPSAPTREPDEERAQGEGKTREAEPAVPVDSRDDGNGADTDPAVRVALVDSGVNYLLPAIAARLARDADGNLLGRDFWDEDDLPFDVQQVSSPFHVLRHGTRTASLLLAEAPDIELVAYRYPRPDMSRMRELVAHADRLGVRIMGMPLGGNDPAEWQAFADAARARPDMLFIASAGNNGRNIDEQPVYPASLAIDNLLTVSSASDFVEPAEGVNWGPRSVDWLLPAENVRVLDFDGSDIEASGSSYAVPRLAAAAARLLQAEPDWNAAELIAELTRRHADGTRFRLVSSGYIPDPLAIGSPVWTPAKRSVPWRSDTEVAAGVRDPMPLDIEVAVLDERWTRKRIDAVLTQASTILGQCSLPIGRAMLRFVDPPDRLRDLATGSAHTLMLGLRGSNIERRLRVILARDTRMQEPYDGEAFGAGNTRTRPWLQDSVWLTLPIKDAGIALAHELFHVLANSGEHSSNRQNLMSRYTGEGQTTLTGAQCDAARRYAEEAGLLN